MLFLRFPYNLSTLLFLSHPFPYSLIFVYVFNNQNESCFFAILSKYSTFADDF